MDERLNYLFKKQLADECSTQERQELILLLADQGNDLQAKDLLKDYWETFDEAIHPSVFESGQGERMINNLLTDYVYTTSKPVKTFSLWPRIAIAAAVMIVVSIAGLYFYNNNKSEQVVSNLGQNIFPANNGATLTLANGKKINLSDVGSGELAKEGSVIITKTANGKLIYQVSGETNQANSINTISTPKGETYQVGLPDGSMVWLNAASSLTYSAKLVVDGKRSVKLDGEAYFEVAKDRRHPFVVQSKGQEVEVLGTHFNINSYADEPNVATTLLEGSVQVSSRKDQKKIKPGEQATSNGAAIAVALANVEQVVSWTKGDFHLNHVNFKTAMREIARWYNVEVIYDASVPNDMVSGGWISRDQPLSAVLRSIESSGLVKFKVKDRKIYVTQ
ncbi:FecR family protein [Pedobacter sp. WC2501]|uniref:FecR family protein n=1 Tax=Pedobacter sp. WC2501 TaxID=3461400 RepID=UPI004046346F